MVKAWITNSVSRDISTSVMCLKNAREVWKDINDRFDKIQKEALSNTSNFSGDSASFSVSPAQSTNNRNFTQRVNFESRKNVSGVSCKYCKKPGHTVEKCYRLYGFPPEFKFTKNKKSASCVQGDILVSPAINQPPGNSSPIHGFTNEQYQHILTMFQQVQVSSGPVSNTPSIEDCGFVHFAGLFTVYAIESLDSHVCASSQTNVDPWILDSGATTHMTPHKHLLHDIVPLVRHFLVTLPNGYKVKVISTGSLHLRHDITLLNVLLGLSMKRSLLVHIDIWGPYNTKTYNGFRMLSPLLLKVYPYEKLHGFPPSYDHLRSFGCMCFATSPKVGRTKFQSRAIPCIFLGYPCGKKGYKLLNMSNSSVFYSRDVIFHEHIFPYTSSSLPSLSSVFPSPFVNIPASPPIITPHLTSPSVVPPVVTPVVST
ncbi:uncharacterized protein [Nicotiana sylvestris]|uniref:uncharacterized protein n=1 Tax=Nicotiana sylvestris TaxID=4096 RepID=UPI00388C4D4E